LVLFGKIFQLYCTRFASTMRRIVQALIAPGLTPRVTRGIKGNASSSKSLY